LLTGVVSELDFPLSDVLQFITEDGSIISARPSGTEPKIKFYCSVNASLQDKAAYTGTDAELNAKIERIMSDLEV
jgi:phosphoglucomutase